MYYFFLAVVKVLEEKNLINQDQADLIDQNFGKHKNLITNFARKNAGLKVPKKYSMELRKFAITLNFYSPKAYRFVRDEFNSVLPCPRTLSKWYIHVNAEPGFTKEAIDTLSLVSKNSPSPIYCALLMDEIAIRKHIEWDGYTFHGYINFGSEIQNETVDEATECFVLMVVGINASWRIPIGYFFCNHLNSTQKVNLVRRCIDVVSETGIKVVSLTFDGCAVNVSMSRALGCTLDANPSNILTTFNAHDTNVNIIFDTAHMIKLVRNTFGEKKILIDHNGGVINFKFIEKLLTLQENEKCHLGNKLKKEHVFYLKKKMKVKLATQLLSNSVADALLFCKDNLKLKEFSDCEATVHFIRIFNDAFDILNSRQLVSYGFKGAVCMKNFNQIKSFIQLFFFYVNNLKLENGQLIVKSQRSTGFLGLLISLNSLLNLKTQLIDTNCLQFLPMYKLSQDHLEIFFGSIRAQGGYNNNPTARQFKSAYKKILVNAQIKDRGLGNCIALEDIPILNCSSVTDPVTAINNSNITLYREVELEPEVFSFETDGFHLHNLSNFSKEVSLYIAGFVSHTLSSKIKCLVCNGALFGNKENFLHSFITKKDKGGLTYPSDDVVKICIVTEKFFKLYYEKHLNKVVVITNVLKTFINNDQIFSSIDYHKDQNGPLDNHIILLIKAIISTYCDIKINYNCRKQNETVSLRTWYNKLTIFKGQ